MRKQLQLPLKWCAVHRNGSEPRIHPSNFLLANIPRGVAAGLTIHKSKEQGTSALDSSMGGGGTCRLGQLFPILFASQLVHLCLICLLIPVSLSAGYLCGTIFCFVGFVFLVCDAFGGRRALCYNYLPLLTLVQLFIMLAITGGGGVVAKAAANVHSQRQDAQFRGQLVL